MQPLPDTISTPFDTMTTAEVRYLLHKLYVSWLRNTNDYTYGVVGTSTVNNCLLRGESTVLSPIEGYNFTDESDNVIDLEYDRHIDEPLGGISYAIMNVALDNTDKRFTPEFDSTIGTAILPNRPVKMAMGFEVNSVNRNVLVFKGLSDMIRENKESRVVEFAGYDYVSYLNELSIDSALYTDQRSDQIIEQILIEAGLGSSQYSLDEGLNTIGYAWFNKEQSVGERIRMICEAEEANFYQDEDGVIRFENRRKYTQSPYNSVVWTVHDSDILEWEQDQNVKIINKCIVNSEPRSSLGFATEIWSDPVTEEVSPGDTLDVWAVMENPNISYETITATTDYVANTASDGSGTDQTANVSVSVDEFSDTAKISITNNHTAKVYITTLRLRGTPAIVTASIRQLYEDDASIDKYDEQVLEINNDFIDDSTFAYYLARAIVNKYKDPLKRIKIRIRGVPRLQLKDKVSVYDRDLETYKSYRVMQIQGIMSQGSFEQILSLREVTDYEADSWATVGTTEVGAENEFVGF